MAQGKIIRFQKSSVILPIDVKIGRTMHENICELTVYVDCRERSKLTVPLGKTQRILLVRNNLGVEIYSGE